jgi:hypothetical protein
MSDRRRRPKSKKTTLPKDFGERLQQGDLEALKAVFETCEVDARSGYGKQTAIMMPGCPEELTRWLVARGADLNATDTYGCTPLHAQAGWRVGNVRVLLELGADARTVSVAYHRDTALHRAAASKNVAAVETLIDAGASLDATNALGLTPLESGLSSCANIDIRAMVGLAEKLLAAGAPRTPAMKQQITEIGERFEFARSGFNPEFLDVTGDALDRLYALFEVEPVPRRVLHDGKAPIAAKSETWRKQHAELWELLVPVSGAAPTVQGEVIRISGRLSHEILGNGGINWDANFRKMARAFVALTSTGTPLSTEEANARDSIVRSLPDSADRDLARLEELAVAWILANPNPVPMAAPDYKR